MQQQQKHRVSVDITCVSTDTSSAMHPSRSAHTGSVVRAPSRFLIPRGFYEKVYRKLELHNVYIHNGPETTQCDGITDTECRSLGGQSGEWKWCTMPSVRRSQREAAEECNTLSGCVSACIHLQGSPGLREAGRADLRQACGLFWTQSGWIVPVSRGEGSAAG